MLTAYDRWVRAKRPPKTEKPLESPIHHWVEEEFLYGSGPGTVGTIVINNRECPYSCLMCGYWQTTTDRTPGDGLVAAQVRSALRSLPPLDSVKLYNCGNFFDPLAVPPADVRETAEIVSDIDLVVVECHPALVGPEVLSFAGRLEGGLEVAMGLEVADTALLAMLNKKMTLGMFRRATGFLKERGVLVKAFILVKPPFVGEGEALLLGRETVDFARKVGADTVSLIPTVTTPGVMEDLQRDRFFAPPHLRTLYEVVRHALDEGGLRVLVDLWEFDDLPGCGSCKGALRDAFVEVNTGQRLPRVDCSCIRGWEEHLQGDRIRSWKEFRGAYADLPWRRPQGTLTP